MVSPTWTRKAARERPGPTVSAESGGGEASTADPQRQESFRNEALPEMEAVYRFALRLAGSPAEAEDLVQETYLRAWRSWEQYTPGTNCKSWLFTICRNVFLRKQERGKRHDEILSEQAPEDPESLSREAPVFAASQESDPEGSFFREMVDDEVLAAIDELPEEYRTAVVLSDLEGLPYQEIADLMEVPVGTVKSRLFRGRRLLQNELYEYAVEMGHIPPREES